MKNKTVKAIIIAMALILFVSCESTRPRPIDAYKGSIVYEKSKSPRYYKVIIKTPKSDRFSKVYVLKIDFDAYKVGDTIR